MKYVFLNEIEEVGVSHNPEIKKKVLIPNGQIPHLTQFSRATFKPGQVANNHIHQDMYEIFYVENGEGEIIVNGSKYSLASGVCVTVEPAENHEVINTGKVDLILTILGIKV